MSLSVSVKKRKKSKSRRISALPRLAIYLDFGGKEVLIKYTSFLEAILNARKKGKLSMKSFLDASLDQLTDIPVDPISKRDLAKIKKMIRGIGKKTAKKAK